MKTLGRVLIILMVFAIVMGITYVVVNAGSSSTSTNTPAFDQGFRPDGVSSQFPNGQRPAFRDRGPRGGGWMFGMVKNVGIITVIVALITVPKSIRQKRIRSASAGAG